jgi:hypothetical protein
LSCLTGRRRFWEAAERVGEWVCAESRAPLSYFDSDLLIGRCLTALNYLYRESREDRYKVAGVQLVHRLKKVQSETGQFDCLADSQSTEGAGLAASSIAELADLIGDAESAEAAEVAQEHINLFLSGPPDVTGSTLPALLWAHRSLGETKVLEVARRTYDEAVKEAARIAPFYINPYLAYRKERGVEIDVHLEEPVDVAQFQSARELHCVPLSNPDTIRFLWDYEDAVEVLIQRLGGKSDGLSTLSSFEGREILSVEFPAPEAGQGVQRVMHFTTSQPSKYGLEVECEKSKDVCSWQLWSARPIRWLRHSKEREVIAPVFAVLPKEELFHVRLELAGAGPHHAVLRDPLDREILAIQGCPGKGPGPIREYAIRPGEDLPQGGTWSLVLHGYRAWVPEALPYFAVSRAAYFNPEEQKES